MSASLGEKLVRETRHEGEGYGKNRIPEYLLSRLWKKKAARQEWLRTSGGAKVRVIYPGMVGTGAGLARGDVEMHVRQKDWHSHGHG